MSIDAYDKVVVGSTALTTTPVQIAAPAGALGSVVMIRATSTAAWLYSDASAGTYVAVAANATVDIPVRNAHSKLWFKAATTATLVTASFVSGS